MPSPRKPGSATTAQQQQSPSGSFAGRNAAGGGNKKKGGDARKSKREVLMLELVNAETLERQAFTQQYTAELQELQLIYEEDGKKTKDHYISILERRLVQAKLQATAKVETMEEKFSEIMNSIQKMLVDTHSIGAVGITDGFLFSEAPTAAAAGSGSSMSSSMASSTRGSPRPTGAPTLVNVVHAARQQQVNQQPASRIASPFVTLDGGGGGGGPLSFSSTPSPPPPPVILDNEEKIRRFFVNTANPTAARLEGLNVKELCTRLDELRDGVTGLVTQCVTRLSSANRRVKDLEHALDEQSVCLASAERLLQNAIVRGDGKIQSAIDVCRDLGRQVKDKLDRQLEKLKVALDEVISRSVEFCLDKHAYATQRNMKKEELVADFCYELDQVKLFQDELLRDIRDRILLFEVEKLKGDSLESAKLFRSNIPEPHRRVLYCCDLAFDRQALLQLLDHVSFEPAAAETVIAVVQAFADSHGGFEEAIARCSGEGSDAHVMSDDGGGGGRLSPRGGHHGREKAARPPPLQYARALNAVAYGDGKIHDRQRIRDARGGDDTLLLKNDGVLSQGLALTTAVRKLRSQGNLHDSNDKKKHHFTGAPFSALDEVPASEILKPTMSASPDQFHHQTLHPDIAGVVVPTDLMFVPPYTKGYVTSEVKRRMKLEQSLVNIQVGKAAENEEAEKLQREMQLMTAGLRRGMLLEVLSAAPGEQQQAATALIPNMSSTPVGARGGGDDAFGSPKHQRIGSGNNNNASSRHLRSMVSNKEEQQPMEVVVTSRLSARFSSANLRELRKEGGGGTSAMSPHKPPTSTPGSAHTARPGSTASQKLGGFGSSSLLGSTGDERTMPVSARIYSEKQRSLLREMMDASS